MRRFFLNARNHILFAVRNPGYAIRSALREATFADERFLAKATGRKAREIRRFLEEPFRDPSFVAHLRRCEGELRKTQFASAELYAKKVSVQYAIVRAVEPDLVVETGVGNGVSTSYLLQALDRNGRGTLHSIEIGDTSYLPPGRDQGWAVPAWLRERWEFRLGGALEMLPVVMDELGTIDIFIHDSQHNVRAHDI